MTILVAGSTGLVGGNIVEHLAGKGAEVLALTRAPEHAELPEGIVPVKGDISDIGAMRSALKGVDTLFLLVPNVLGEHTYVLQALSVAREIGIKGIVYLSVFRAEDYVDVPHFSSKYSAERMIEQMDLPATILRPAYFIQNDARQKEPLLSQGVYAMPIGNQGISMVDARDIGEAAALELLRRERSHDSLPSETYTLVGPDVIDGETACSIWAEVLGRPIRYGGDDLDCFETRLKSVAPEWMTYDMRLMMRRYQQDGAIAVSADIARLTELLGRPLRSYRDFAAASAAEWGGH
ncbi:SDR family oxidoreductase [Paraburkholderia heleia]|uniref:SDR family oxidoreductase n=1 Tax=Paraburkholderia heleia TaxID=634127 RepID=UPI002AB760DE|nr:NmrA family NAD(P)-binding protein [Paraburkholderia heleia]